MDRLLISVDGTPEGKNGEFGRWIREGPSPPGILCLLPSPGLAPVPPTGFVLKGGKGPDSPFGEFISPTTGEGLNATPFTYTKKREEDGYVFLSLDPMGKGNVRDVQAQRSLDEGDWYFVLYMPG